MDVKYFVCCVSPFLNVGAYRVCYSLLFVCVLLFLLGEPTVQSLFCLCLGKLGYSPTSLPVCMLYFLCFISFQAISSLDRDSMSKQASLQHQSG
jgi:hypothetical protein